MHIEPYVYAETNPEDIAKGWYWIVSLYDRTELQYVNKFGSGLYAYGYVLFKGEPDYRYAKVESILKAGSKFYRVPDLCVTQELSI